MIAAADLLPPTALADVGLRHDDLRVQQCPDASALQDAVRRLRDEWHDAVREDEQRHLDGMHQAAIDARVDALKGAAVQKRVDPILLDEPPADPRELVLPAGVKRPPPPRRHFHAPHPLQGSLYTHGLTGSYATHVQLDRWGNAPGHPGYERPPWHG